MAGGGFRCCSTDEQFCRSILAPLPLFVQFTVSRLQRRTKDTQLLEREAARCSLEEAVTASSLRRIQLWTFRTAMRAFAFRCGQTFYKLDCFKHTELVRGSKRKRRRQVGGGMRESCYTKNSRQHSSTPQILRTSTRRGETKNILCASRNLVKSWTGRPITSILILNYDLND